MTHNFDKNTAYPNTRHNAQLVIAAHSVASQKCLIECWRINSCLAYFSRSHFSDSNDTKMSYVAQIEAKLWFFSELIFCAFLRQIFTMAKSPNLRLHISACIGSTNLISGLNQVVTTYNQPNFFQASSRTSSVRNASPKSEKNTNLKVRNDDFRKTVVTSFLIKIHRLFLYQIAQNYKGYLKNTRV